MALEWSNVNYRGIRSGSDWVAGRVYDVLELDENTILVASANGGVWQLAADYGIPLSLDWEATDLTSLARGPYGSNHFYAAGSTATDQGALYQTNVMAHEPLWVPWNAVTLTATDGPVGGIHRIVVTQYEIILATASGLWVSAIPPRGSNTLTLSRAVGTPSVAVDFFDVTLVGDHTVVAATTSIEDEPGVRGIYVGASTVHGFTMHRVAAPTHMPLERMVFPTLAASPNDPQVVYAAYADNNALPAGGAGTFIALLRSDSAGETWTRCTAFASGTTAMIVDHGQQGFAGAMAVSPRDSNTVVLGYVNGWMSQDGGATFIQRDMVHEDKHGYRFSATTDRLYDACDGGVGYTEDLGIHTHSEYNQYLANLQFYSPADGFAQASATSVSGGQMVGGGLQDNDDVYCVIAPGGATTPWNPVSTLLYDGEAVFFPATGGAIYTHNGYPLTAAWHAPGLQADPTPIHVRAGKPGLTYENNTISGRMAMVTHPTFRARPPMSSSGQLMIAVAAANHKIDDDHEEQRDLYGLFANDDGSDKHWDYLGTLPLASGEMVSTIASLRGNWLLVGTYNGGHIWRVDPTDVSRATVVGPLVLEAESDCAIASIAIENDSPDITAYAVFRNGRNSASLYRTTASNSWSPCRMPTTDRVTTIATGAGLVFAATEHKVYMSSNHGDTWREESAGLPQLAHCSDLAFVGAPDGTGQLYLATWGWSMWVTTVNPVTISITQTTPREACAAFFGGLEVVGGEIARLRANVSGGEGAAPTYAWTARADGTSGAYGAGLIMVHQATERDCWLTVPTDCMSFTVTLIVSFPSGYTQEVQQDFTVLSGDQANLRLLGCEVTHVQERVNRIPPIIILNKLGPDPAPAAIAHELVAISSEVLQLAERVEQIGTTRGIEPPAPALPAGQNPQAPHEAGAKEAMNAMKPDTQRRFMFELGAGITTGILFLLTYVKRDWIEALFGIDPDSGSGALEWLIVGGLLLVTLALFSLAGYELRRAATRAA
jgi:hypothetical protein